MGSFDRLNEALETHNYSEYFLLYKKNVKYRQKSKKLFSIFLRKTLVEARKFIANFLTILDFMHMRLPSGTIMSYVICN